MVISIISNEMFNWLIHELLMSIFYHLLSSLKKKLFLKFFIQLSFLFNLLEMNGNKYYKY